MSKLFRKYVIARVILRGVGRNIKIFFHNRKAAFINNLISLRKDPIPAKNIACPTCHKKINRKNFVTVNGMKYHHSCARRTLGGVVLNAKKPSRRDLAKRFKLNNNA